MTRPRRRRQRLAPVLAALAALTACTSSPSAPEDEGNPPPLPSVASAEVDLSFFLTRPSAPETGSSLAWTTAWEVVALTLTELVQPTRVPVAALRAAAGVRPARERGTDRWRWPVAVTVDGQAFTGAVVGGPSAIGYGYAVMLTGGSPSRTDYVWMEGQMSAFETGGYWNVHNGTNAPGTYAHRIQWSREGDRHDLVIGRPGGSGRAGHNWMSRYGYLALTSSNAAETFIMSWSPPQGHGAVFRQLSNGNRCWNAQLQDRSC